MIAFHELKALPLLAVDLLETLINKALKLDPESLIKIAALEGKVIGIEISGANMAFYLMPQAEGVKIQSTLADEPDVYIKGGPIGLARMSLDSQPRNLFGEGVEIEGDVALGHKVKTIIDDLDIDWEEQLSRLVGDAAAHQLGNFFRSAQQWSTKTAQTLAEDVVEYFQEESRDLVVREDLDDFLNAVDSLRVDTDRLEQRVQRLQHTPNKG